MAVPVVPARITAPVGAHVDAVLPLGVAGVAVGLAGAPVRVVEGALGAGPLPRRLLAQVGRAQPYVDAAPRR